MAPLLLPLRYCAGAGAAALPLLLLPPLLLPPPPPPRLLLCCCCCCHYCPTAAAATLPLYCRAGADAAAPRLLHNTPDVKDPTNMITNFQIHQQLLSLMTCYKYVANRLNSSTRTTGPLKNSFLRCRKYYYYDEGIIEIFIHTI